MKRLLILVHYNSCGDPSSHIQYTLEKMKSLFNRVVFVSNSPLSNEGGKKLKPHISKIIERENRGFDFGAWKDALLQEGWDSLSRYDNVTLMNDTCFGPLFDMEPIYKQMEESSADFWGISNHKSYSRNILADGYLIPEHIQSYFLFFKNNVVVSEAFRNFWEKVEYLDDVLLVIKKYETQLTRILNQAGFKYRALIDYRDVNNSNHTNIAHIHPDICIKKRSPFIKIKSFLFFPHPQYLKQLISRVSDYDTRLIDDHLQQIFNPNESIRMIDRSLQCCCLKDESIKPVLKTAIHLHVYYLDVFMKYAEAFGKVEIPFDLYLSTDTEEKKREILILSEEKKIKKLIRKISVCKNRGRDIAPWLVDFKDINETYDIVGHFQTKKTAWADEWVGESWQDEIIESLIKNTDYIINYFQKHENLGIVIPDIPYCYSYVLTADTWGGNRDIFNRFWERMNLIKKLDARLLDYPIMPYGNMFWYRPAALKPLFDLNLSLEDFPEEPISVDGTIAHAIERLPVYIAWSQGYDFRIAITEQMKNSLLCRETAVYSGISRKNRLEKKIGEIILWLPYHFYKIMKRIIDFKRQLYFSFYKSPKSRT